MGLRQGLVGSCVVLVDLAAEEVVIVRVKPSSKTGA